MVLFYHLMRGTVEETVGSLLTRAMGQGWRVMLRGTDSRRLERLDQWLWLHPEDGFLPHGIEGGPHDADQPVRPGHGAKAQCFQGFATGFWAMPIGPADQECDLPHALVRRAAQKHGVDEAIIRAIPRHSAEKLP